jgi:segregation and condensation protein B
LEIKKLQGAAEAVLFAAGEAVELEKLAAVLQLDKATAEKLMKNLMDRYDTEYSGVRIVRLDNGYQMCTSPQFAGEVRAVLDIRRNVPLSQAAMEVLAIIAYNQPVTKGFIEQVRGVDCSAVLGGLTSKGLVEECGRLELPGRPLQYETTPEFLRCLGISSLEELPPVEKQEPVAAAVAE